MAAAQNADAAYRQGIEAVDRQDWIAASDAMAEAIGLRPDPGGARIKIYGMRFESYTPYYYLGLARAALGDCEGALLAWQQTSDQELRRNQVSDLTRRRAECQSRQVAADNVPVEPLDKETKAEKWIAPGPPAGLRQSAGDFLAHRYGQALDQLNPLLQQQPPDDDAPAEALAHYRSVRATALLLRAACRLALHQMAGDNPSDLPSRDLPTQARADIEAVRRLKPDLRPSAFWFSPAFRAFFASVSAG